MSVAFVGVSALQTWSAAASVTVPVAAGAVAGDLLIVPLAFEGEAGGSGPYVTNTNESGWSRLDYSPPSASGSALEVWFAIYSSGPTTTFNFGTNRTGCTRGQAYRCPAGTSVVPSAWVRTAFTGSNPTLNGVTTSADDSLVWCGIADTLSGVGYGFPAGFTIRMDNTRAGFGTVEVGVFDINQATAGPSGSIAVTASASPAGAAGAALTVAWACQPASVQQHMLPLMGVGT